MCDSVESRITGKAKPGEYYPPRVSLKSLATDTKNGFTQISRSIASQWNEATTGKASSARSTAVHNDATPPTTTATQASEPPKTTVGK